MRSPISPTRRRRAEALMQETVVVRRPTGETTTDENYNVVPVFDIVYDPRVGPHYGKAKSNTFEAYETNTEAAGATAVVSCVRYDFPVGSFKSRPGDIVTTVANPVDPMLVGRSVRLANEAPVKTHATAYRVFAELNVDEEVPPWQP